jgi:ABC-2 type transport system permease protein
MAVYRRQYQPYAGPLTPERARWLVVLRYELAELLRSRSLLAFLFVTCVPILVEAAIIYLAHNPAARTLLGLVKMDGLVQIDSGFFRQMLATQCFFGLLLSAWVGPSLVAADLANGALSLYLCRPFSRFEYVLGKAMVLVVLLSLVTWVPALVLYLLNGALDDDGWSLSHLRIALALVVGSFIWIAVMALFSLAVSCWIKWRLAASATLFGIFFVSAGFGEAVVVVLRLSWGRIFSLGHMFEVIWAHLFATPNQDKGVPLLAAWAVLLGVCVFSLAVIGRRLRAREVVR